MNYRISRVLISEDDIKAKVAELGAKITADYQGKVPIMVCVLKGAAIFFADLLREIKLDVKMEFLIVSSYGSGMESSGRVKLVKDIDCGVENEHVIIVEDIIDSGNTLTYLKELFRLRRASSVAVCSLLDKPSRRTTGLEGDYVGFAIPDEFAIGYGLDLDEKYRNLKCVSVLTTSEDV